jgi:hypothetical protein
LIESVAEVNPDKFGCFTPGTLIPMIDESEVLKSKPDYLLVLPWHFISEFVEREREYLEKGGAFIVPCPQFRIYTKEDLK